MPNSVTFVLMGNTQSSNLRGRDEARPVAVSWQQGSSRNPYTLFPVLLYGCARSSLFVQDAPYLFLSRERSRTGSGEMLF